MRIMSLNEMLQELRHEARLSSNASHGTHLQDRHIALLRRVQEEVYQQYDWPMLRKTGTVSLAPGQRYINYPDTLAFDTINEAWARTATDNDWRPLTYGITANELNEYDSDAGEQTDNVSRWNHHLPAGAEQIDVDMFEVWPIPNVATTIRFQGSQKLKPLVDPAVDHSTIDGPSVVLHAAAEMLAGQKAEDAALKLQKAQQRVDWIRKNQNNPDNSPQSLYPQSVPMMHQRIKAW